jgi:putative ABC transport system ATP-binding protein
MTTALRVERLSKTFTSGNNTFQALKDVSFAIGQGETVAIVGKSGSGKSTLMHQLALLDTPTSGELFIQEKLSTGLSAKDTEKLRNKQFGFVFQQFFLNGNDSVLNNVVLPLKVAGMSKKDRTAKAMQVLEQVELTEKASNRAADLSGGQKQRVCIARALVNDPTIIFADEPTGNLDSATGKKIEEMLFGLNKEKNITLIIVTHDPDLAKKCQRQLHIVDGKLMEEK